MGAPGARVRCAVERERLMEPQIQYPTSGEILVSDIVRGLARTSAGVRFEDRGEHELKGIDEPQRLFAVKAGK